MSEQVNHPAHYGGADNTYETIKVLRAWLTPAEYIGFLRGNVIKYLSRAGKKGSACTDWSKAAWYQTELIKLGTVLDDSQPKARIARPASEFDRTLHGRVLWWNIENNFVALDAATPKGATHWTPVERPEFPEWRADGYAG